MHATAILLLAGLWTPIAGVLAPTVELWAAFSEPGDHWVQILLGTLGAGLALLGPGVGLSMLASLDGSVLGLDHERVSLKSP